MKLIAKSGREIELNEEQASQYMELVLLKGESFAKATAFGDQLPSQRTDVFAFPQGTTDVVSKMAAIRRHKRRQRNKAYRQHVLFLKRLKTLHDHVVEALKQMAPGLHPYAFKRIFKRSHQVFGWKLSYCLPDIQPVDWPTLSYEEKAEAIAKAKELLGKMNANDWRKLKQQNSSSDLRELITHANLIALSELL